MPELDEVIRDACARGELTHLSVGSVNGGVFSAVFAVASGGNSMATDKDPVAALIKAITNAKMVRRVRVSKPNEPDMDFG